MCLLAVFYKTLIKKAGDTISSLGPKRCAPQSLDPVFAGLIVKNLVISTKLFVFSGLLQKNCHFMKINCLFEPSLYLIYGMPHTSLKYFTQVLSVITQFDVSQGDCLKAAGLTQIPDSPRVNADYVSQILRFASEQLGDPLIGIKCGLKYPILQYTRPAEILKFCDNIAHAAEVYHAYSPLFHTLGRSLPIVSEGGVDRMIWAPNFDAGHIDKYRLHVDLILTNYLTSINWLSWKIPNAVRQINVRHDPIAAVQDYQDLWGCDVEFGQSEYALILEDNVKHVPFASSDPAELAKIKVNLDKAMNILLQSESLIDRVELQIRLSLEHQASKKADIAKALGLSERSMTRALAEKETTFKDIKNRVIRDLAVAKINQGHPLAEIAHSLGYNDQSAFTRAFKKWFGHPPGKGKLSHKD